MAGEDPHDLADAMTIWAVPGVVGNPAHPELGSVAVLTIIPSFTLHTGDDYPGADTVNVVTSALLGRGFGLLSGPDVSELLALPVLADSHVELSEQDSLVRITDGDSALYDGGLGTTPPGWAASAKRRGLLVVMFSSEVDPETSDRATQFAQACAAGAVVGALIRLPGATDSEGPR